MSRYTNEEYGYRRPRGAGMQLLESGLTLLGGLAVGAGIMYLLDPEEGQYRRRTIRKTTGNALHGLGDTLSSAYETVAESLSGAAGTVGETAGDLTERARHPFSRRRRTMGEYASDVASRGREMFSSDRDDDDEGMGTGMLLGLILGGTAAAAVLYMMTTQYEAVRRGDFRQAVTGAYESASEAVSNAAQRASEYVGGGQQQDQGQSQQVGPNTVG